MLFNADKSKSIISEPREVPTELILRETSLVNVIENVESWPQLGRVMINNGSNKLDIISHDNKFIGKVSNVMCWFWVVQRRKEMHL